GKGEGLPPKPPPGAGEESGEPLEVPTFSQAPLKGGGSRHYFVYAVPRGHKENDEDRAIKARAAEILAEYKARRERYIGEGKPGGFALVGDWDADPDGRWSVGQAMAGGPPREGGTGGPTARAERWGRLRAACFKRTLAPPR